MKLKENLFSYIKIKRIIFKILLSFYPPKVELKEEIGSYNNNEIFLMIGLFLYHRETSFRIIETMRLYQLYCL